MSDFDKEAEREKLREKYERDQKKREAAEKMSELLLKGATMTNAHCSECGDPVFRYDGQEFCATCEKPVDRGTGQNDESGEGDEAGGDGKTGGSAIEVASPSDDTRVVFGSDDERADDPSTPDADGEAAREQTDDSRVETRREQDQHSVAEEQTEPRTDEFREGADEAEYRAESEQSTAGTERRDVRPDVVRQVPADSGRDEDLTAARNALVRTLTKFSQQAEAADDPQRAREYLRAAREAAETLSALPR